jgi:hypothetical protein
MCTPMISAPLPEAAIGTKRAVNSPRTLGDLLYR